MPRREATRREALIAELSQREREVLALLVRGMSHRDVARELDISPRTVEAHKARIMSKLGAANLADLVRIADGRSR